MMNVFPTANDVTFSIFILYGGYNSYMCFFGCGNTTLTTVLQLLRTYFACFLEFEPLMVDS